MSQPKHHREGKVSLHTGVLSAPPSAPAPAPAPRFLKRFLRQQKLWKKKNTDNHNLKHTQETWLIKMHTLSWK